MPNNLTKTDLDKLAGEFITPQLAELAKLFRVDSLTSANLLGRKPTAREDLSGVMFPYFYPGENNPRQYRLRLDNPLKDANGKIIAKYLSSVGAKSNLYFPPNTTKEMLSDINLPLVIVEGEKKGLSKFRVSTNDLTEHPRFLSLALQGVWNWKESHKSIKREIGDFHSITWSGRKVTILFDVDKLEKYQVAFAEKELAKHLKSKGAKVFICSMPKIKILQGGAI